MSIIRDIVKNERVNINSTRISGVASSVLLNQDSVAIEDFLVTKNFAAVTYTGNGDTQDITTGISSIDFTVANNGSGFWHDRGTGDCIVKNDAGDVVDEGSCVCNVSKVQVKRRDDTGSNIVVDGLRGLEASLLTDTTDAEGTITIDTNTAGIVLANNDANIDTATYIAYQTLYTHISWFKNSMGKRTIIAYNPITREYMGMVEESDATGAEIDMTDMVGDTAVVEYKQLDADTDWQVDALGHKLVLNTNAAEV